LCTGVPQHDIDWRRYIGSRPGALLRVYHRQAKRWIPALLADERQYLDLAISNLENRLSDTPPIVRSLDTVHAFDAHLIHLVGNGVPAVTGQN
jgi:hypothetical protein